MIQLVLGRALVVAAAGLVLSQALHAEPPSPPIFLPDAPFWQFVFEPSEADLATGAGNPLTLVEALHAAEQAGDARGAARVRVDLAYVLYRQGDLLAAQAMLVRAKKVLAGQDDVTALARCMSLEHLIAVDRRLASRFDLNMLFEEAPDEEIELPPLTKELGEASPGRQIPPQLAPWLALFEAYQAYGEMDSMAAAEIYGQVAAQAGAEPLARGLAAVAAAYVLPDVSAAEELLAQAREAFADLPQGLAQADLVAAAKHYQGGDLAAARQFVERADGFFERQRIWAGVIQSELIRAKGEREADEEQQALAAAMRAERLADDHLPMAKTGPASVWELSSGQIGKLTEERKLLPGLSRPASGLGPGGSGARARAFYNWARQTGHAHVELIATRTLAQSLIAEGQWNDAVIYALTADDLLGRLLTEVPLRKRVLAAARLDYEILLATGLAGEPAISESYSSFVAQLAAWAEVVLPMMEEDLDDEDMQEIRRGFAQLSRLADRVDSHRLQALKLAGAGRRKAAAAEIDLFFKALPTLIKALSESFSDDSERQNASLPSSAMLDYLHALDRAAVLRDESVLLAGAEHLASALEEGGAGSGNDTWLPVTLGGIASRASRASDGVQVFWGEPGGEWSAKVDGVIARVSRMLQAQSSLRLRRWGRIVSAFASTNVQEALAVKMLGGTPEDSAKREATIFRDIYASQLAISLDGTSDFIPLGGARNAAELNTALKRDTEPFGWTFLTGHLGAWRWLQSLQGLPVSKAHTDPAWRRSMKGFIEFAQFGFGGVDYFEEDDEEDEEDGSVLRDLDFGKWASSYPALVLMLSDDRESADSMAAMMRLVQADLDRAAPSSVVPRLLGQEAPDLFGARRNLAVNLSLYEMAVGNYAAAVEQLNRLVQGEAGLSGIDAYQYHYALALCYRRMKAPDAELRSLAAAVAASSGLRSVMPTRSLALRMADVRQLLMEEYLGGLARRGRESEMAAVLWSYRRSSLVPAAAIQAAREVPSTDIDTVKHLYEALASGYVDAPVTVGSERSWLELFDLEDVPTRPGHPTLNGVNALADFLVNELGSKQKAETAAAPSGLPVVGQGELLISYFVGLRGLYSVTLDEWGVLRQHYRRVDSSRLEELCSRFREGLTAEGVADDAVAAEIYDLVLGFVPEITGKRQLEILPDGPLQLIPFQALRPSAAAPYLIERFRITYTSGVQEEARAASPGESPRLLVIGNPGGDLAHSQAEARDIERAFGSQALPTLLGPQATLAALRQDLPKAGFVHFASHAKRRADQPNFSYLQLAGPDRLYSLDLDGLDFKGKHVFLGACETLLAEAAVGDDIYGIAEAFLGVGASSVVATLWSIDDGASAKLGGLFYDRLRSGATEAEALADAVRILISGRAGPEFASPFYWAGFNRVAPLRFAASTAPESAMSAKDRAAEGEAALEMLRESVDRLNEMTSELLVLKHALEETKAEKEKLSSEFEELSEENSEHYQQFLETKAAVEEVRGVLAEMARAAGTTATLSGVVVEGSLIITVGAEPKPAPASGQLLDDQGRRLFPRSKVTLVDLDSREESERTREIVADDKGGYSFIGLPVGHRYRIRGLWLEKEFTNGKEIVKQFDSLDEIVLSQDTRYDVELEPRPSDEDEAEPD